MKLNLILFLFFTSLFTKSTSSKNDKYDKCSEKFKCGILEDLGYPFYDGSTQRPAYCGFPGFKLDCIPGIQPKITISDQEYNLTNADKYSITVSRNDTWLDGCPDRLTNTTLDFSIFNLSSTDQNITFFYDCQGSNAGLPDQVANATCDRGYGLLDGFYLTQKMVDEYTSLNLFENCKYIFIPVLESKAKAVDEEQDKLDALISAFEEGFDLGLIVNNTACDLCMGSKGVCGYNFSSNKFQCHCDDQDYDLQCGVSSPTGQDSGTPSKNLRYRQANTNP